MNYELMLHIANLLSAFEEWRQGRMTDDQFGNKIVQLLKLVMEKFKFYA